MKILWCFWVFFSFSVLAIDETEFIQLPEIKSQRQSRRGMTTWYDEHLHSLDLNGDGKKEKVKIAKRDHVDEIFLQGEDGKVFFQKKIYPWGMKSGFRKLQLKKLDDHWSVLLLYYDEGFSKYYQVIHTGRLYLITFKHQTLDTWLWYEGPALFLRKIILGKVQEINFTVQHELYNGKPSLLIHAPARQNQSHQKKYAAIDRYLFIGKEGRWEKL